ncbi:hypothetical protein K402DRAFT_387852 [Aulographum hederae CBS 113979]|uniref:Ubiquitin 3 binding protein But2 C-terminal domain-containing protein n=1 Tax=Aulographum hederae CBS 113979 TaxID=1176131 RepID=A0A6G1HG37_9PEZI|nr:hypothetical protein K402DRAFT_387852 [Aulographum hederae CBS 113979]
MFKSIVSALALASAVSAVPAWSPPKSYSLKQLARFDNENGVPLVAVAPIDIYLDIKWNGMSLAETLIDSTVPGIVPNTPKNYAAYAVPDTATITQGQPAMTVNYPDSTISSFSLRSFYYGCSIAAETSVTAVPTTCTVTITGKDANGKTLKTQSFKYDPKGALSAQMMKASVSGFDTMYSVEFDTTTGNLVTDLLVATVIDTVDYTVYGANPIPN